MAVSMGLRHNVSGEYREVPVATLRAFREDWLPACQRLDLQFVPLFAGGALTTVPPELIPDIVRELRTLLAALVNDRTSEWIVERVRAILTAFAETNPAEWEYDFG